MNIQVTEAFAALTGDGDGAGYVTVSDNSKFYPGAQVWLSDDGTAGSQRCIITDLVSTNKIGLRFIGTAPSYTRNDVSAWKTAKSAAISQEAQVVRVEQPTFSKKPLL